MQSRRVVPRRRTSLRSSMSASTRSARNVSHVRLTCQGTPTHRSLASRASQSLGSPTRARRPSGHPSASDSASSLSASDAGAAEGFPVPDLDLEASIPPWLWASPPPVPGQLVYLREAQSQSWLVGLMLGDHPARNGLVFLALTLGACHYIDPGDKSFDACEGTDF